jgi:hypothetical protein
LRITYETLDLPGTVISDRDFRLRHDSAGRIPNDSTDDTGIDLRRQSSDF